MGQAKTVRVGGTEYSLRPFKAFKAIIVGEILSDVGDEIRELLSAVEVYRREYGQEHVVRFTAAQIHQRKWDIPDSAFVTPDGGEPYVDLPGVPSNDEILMFGFPRAFKLAREEVTKLLALLVVPDEELRVAEGAGELDGALRQLGDRMLHEGELGEIVDLLAAAVEHAEAQLAAHRESVGKLRAAWGRMKTSTPPNDLEGLEPDERSRTIAPMVVVAPEQTDSPDGSPESSTPSPTPTGGPETSASMGLTGASSSI